MQPQPLQKHINTKSRLSTHRPEAVFEPIGYAGSGVKKPRFGGWRALVSEVVLKKKFAKGLALIGKVKY